MQPRESRRETTKSEGNEMRKFFLKHSRWYRKLIHKLFGIKEVDILEIPTSVYGDFSVNYMVYDKEGKVTKGFKTLREALKNKGNLGLTVLYEGY